MSSRYALHYTPSHSYSKPLLSAFTSDQLKKHGGQSHTGMAHIKPIVIHTITDRYFEQSELVGLNVHFVRSLS